LTPADVVIGHQHGFNLAHLRGRFSKPRQNRVFLVAGRAGDAADPVPFRKLRERLDDLVGGCLPPIKHSAFCRRERLATGSALIALLSVARSTKLDDIPCRCRLRFPIIRAVRIGTEIARLDKL